MPQLSVVIPAYNEAERLGPSLDRALEYLERRGGSFEVLVVDDGSSDATGRVAAAYADRNVRLLTHPRNRGKGAALRTGVAATGGDRVLVSDADFSTPIEELPKLERRLADADLVLGSRAAPGADVRERQPLYRELMGKTFNLLIRILGVRGLRDTQCGFKLLRGEVGRELFAEMEIDGFAYDVEMVWLARQHGYRVVEVGVVWVNSAASKVDPIRSSLAMFRDVIALRRRRLPR
ncbi:MAG TPA: dolichyl-phosphate beta-glucosyltransferase [Thermoanaerobaculia bacterium]|jgi:dolichyl-phosphate beta-glucosyltransferase